jgi:LAO/AO transport system kinase
VGELWEAIEAHRAHLGERGRLERRRAANLAAEVLAVSTARARGRLERSIEADPELVALVERVQRREVDPLSAVREIMERVFRIDGDENPADPR